nr:hypothetical protein [Candidatus Sigynarchaeota archaeon]
MPISIITALVEFAAFLALTTVFIAACIIYYYNMRTKWEYPEDDFQWRFPDDDITTVKHNVLLDQHVHTKFRGGNLSMRQNIRWHLANGFNAMVLTEHNCIQPAAEVEAIAKEFAGKIVVLQGMEWTTERIHLNFIGVTSWSDPVPPRPTDLEIQRAIRAAKSQGAIIVVNHPSSQQKKAPDHPSFENLANWGVDYIEVAGQGTFETEAAKLCKKGETAAFGSITGTDIHFPIPANCWTALNAPSFTREGIMAELRAKRTEAIYSEAGTPDFTTRLIPEKYKKMELFIEIGKVFSTTTRSQLHIKWQRIATLLLIMIGFFVVVEVFSWAISLLLL